MSDWTVSPGGLLRSASGKAGWLLGDLSVQAAVVLATDWATVFPGGWATETSGGMTLGDELDGDPEPPGDLGWRAEPAAGGAIRPEGAYGCGPLSGLRARRATAGLGELGWEHKAVGSGHGPVAGPFAGSRRL